MQSGVHIEKQNNLPSKLEYARKENIKYIEQLPQNRLFKC